MNQVMRSFRCFRCHVFNDVIVPRYFKWKKCRRCHSKNYFNYNPNLSKRTYFQNNFNKYRNNNDSSFDDESDDESEEESDEESFGFNENCTFNERNNNRNISSIFSNNSLMNNNILNNRVINGNSRTLNPRNGHRIVPNESINRNQININHFNTNPYNNNNNNNNNNFISLESKKEENINIPWLKKTKFNEEIKNKYKDEICSICMEEINRDISITKCNHIFHYNCIGKYINDYGKKECPICRRDLKTGQEKQIVDRNNFIQLNNESSFFNNLNIYPNNRDNRNIRDYIRNNDNNMNYNYRFREIRNDESSTGGNNCCNVIAFIIAIFFIMIFLANSDE